MYWQAYHQCPYGNALAAAYVCIQHPVPPLYPAASQFYKWDEDKLYRNYGDTTHFFIITQPAGEVRQPVHDRMPVRIPEALIDDWLYDGKHTHEILETATVPLVRHQDIEQISLW